MSGAQIMLVPWLFKVIVIVHVHGRGEKTCTHTSCMYMCSNDHLMQLCVRVLLFRFLYDDNTFHSHVSAVLCVNSI